MTAGGEHPFRVALQEPVRAAKGLPRLDLLVRVPNTRLPVEVVDESGRGVPRAEWTVLGKRSFGDWTDEGGRAEVTGLKPGPQCLRVAQSDPPRKSAETAAVVQEGKTPPVRLVLPDRVDVRGRLRPRLGAAAGARVLVWPAGSRGRVDAFSQSTDEDGEFRLALPPSLKRCDLMVLAPGSALRMTRAEVSRNRLLEIDLDTAGGTLILDLPGGAAPQDAGPLEPGYRAPAEPCDPAARQAGALTTLHILRRWADLQDTPQTPGRLVVPNVEPGPYTLCATDSAPFVRRGAPREGDARCVGGVLAAAGELTLELPRRTPAAPTSTAPPPRSGRRRGRRSAGGTRLWRRNGGRGAGRRGR